MAPSRRLPSNNAFNAGELSPLMASRQDQARYAYGAKRMRNFIPALQGPARKRPGFKFGCDLGGASWLVPFVFSQTDAWDLVFQDSKLRFFTDHGPVVEATKAITGVTQASPGVLHVVGHSYSVNDEVSAASIGGMTELNGRTFLINSVPDADHVTLKDMWGVVVDTSAYTAYTSGGTLARAYKVDSPYAMTDLTDGATGCCLLTWAQSGDVIYLCCPGFAVRKLTRSASTSWAFSILDQTGGPFETVDPDQTITVYSGASSGTGQTLTASSAIFTSNHIGALFLLERNLTEITTSWETGKVIAVDAVRRSQGHYYKALNNGKTTGASTPSHTEGSRFDGDDGVNWQYLHSGYGWAKITAIGGGGTTATVDILSYIPEGAVGSGNASTRWAFGEFSIANGYPEHVTFFRERLTFARDTQVFCSVPSDFENFSQRDAGVVAADSAISLDIRSGVNDAIKWIAPSSDLLIGTAGREYSLGEISSAEPLGPGNIAALAGPGYGSRRVQPAIVNDAVMYVQPSGKVMRELRFAFETDGYVALNRTAFAEHIAKGQLIQLSFQSDPDSIVWSNSFTGDLLGMSIEREHDLLAWHKHPVGGSFSTTANGIVTSHCVIPAPDGTRQELNVVVKRTINGQTKYYLEYASAHWDEDTDAQADMFYVDSGLTYSGAATSTVSNLRHLQGQTVSVLGGGKDLGDFLVSATGTIDLGDATVTAAQVGLPYIAVLETMNVVPAGMLARIVQAWSRFIATVSAKWSTIVQREQSVETGTPKPMEFGNVSVSAVAPAVTRLVKTEGLSGHARELTWVITHDRPTACTVAGIAYELIVTTEK